MTVAATGLDALRSGRRFNSSISEYQFPLSVIMLMCIWPPGVRDQCGHEEKDWRRGSSQASAWRSITATLGAIVDAGHGTATPGWRNQLDRSREAITCLVRYVLRSVDD